MKMLRKIKIFLLSLWNKRAFALRALLCWAIGLAFLWNDYNSNYDYRFKVRGNTKKQSDVVLLMLTEYDWRKLRNVEVDTFESLRALYINETLTDNFYWDEKLWSEIIRKLLIYEPKKIGLTFHFGQNLGSIAISEETKKLFRNPKIVWPARINQEGQFQLPLFSRSRNTGFINLYPDVDGIVRTFNTSFSDVPHYTYSLSEPTKNLKSYPKTLSINYQRFPDAIQTFKVLDLLKGKITAEAIKDKTVIIGTQDANDHVYPTPMGFMTKSEIIGQIVQNFHDDSFPKKLPIEYYSLYLLFLLTITLLIVFEYPQTHALALIFGFGSVITGVSAWIFDAFYIWSPIWSGTVQMVSTYIIFIGYKLSQNERKTWRLEQEKKYLAELEQLKNNFISLISHDLKTPIAKIQGITGRLLQNETSSSLILDLETIRNSSQDLHRYIQSILQVIRVESSDFKIKKEATDINQIIEKVVSQIVPLAREKNITLDLMLEPLFSAEFDIGLIQEVILNLIENAIKYTPKNGTIAISSREEPEHIVIEVKDTGDGIPAEEQTQVWEKFYRGKKHNLSTQGTGLGLYLVKYFIELHGGSVFLKSETQNATTHGTSSGTTVGFRLPL